MIAILVFVVVNAIAVAVVIVVIKIGTPFVRLVPIFIHCRLENHF